MRGTADSRCGWSFGAMACSPAVAWAGNTILLLTFLQADLLAIYLGR